MEIARTVHDALTSTPIRRLIAFAIAAGLTVVLRHEITNDSVDTLLLAFDGILNAYLAAAKGK